MNLVVLKYFLKGCTISTIKDVAKKAKLSVATVSRVMRGKEHVSEKAKQQVQTAIDELKYQPNVIARHLRERKTKTILVIVPDIRNTFFPNVFRGIESVAMKRGYQVFLQDMQNDAKIEEKYFNTLSQKQVDGIISLSAKVGKHIIESVAKEYQLVIAGQYLDNTNVPIVAINNVDAAQKAVEHLIKLGHKRIAHIAGPLNQLIFQNRLKGYYRALENYNIPIDSQLVFYGDYTYISGYTLASKIIELHNPVTAIFSANDEMAIGMIKAIKAVGKRVPEDYAVVGFDNIHLSLIVEPTLTTIDQPKFEMGTKAIEILLDLIDGKTLVDKKVTLGHELIVRESCGAHLNLIRSH